MEGDLPIEQKIAKYLETNHVTIIPESRADGTEVLGFIQYHGGQIRELGEMTLGRGVEVDADNLRKGLQLPGFVNDVRRPLARLLRQVGGDFYAGRLDPIHDACDRVESEYGL